MLTEIAPSTILVVDDEASSLTTLSDFLEQEGYSILPARSGAQALELLERHEPDLIITDLRMREIDGMRVLARAQEKAKDTPVIVMTAFTTMETAIEAISRGAYDYLSKPFKLDHLRMVVARALAQAHLKKENRRLQNLVNEQQQTEIIGRSPEMVEVYKLVARVSALPTTVLIQGESGTGKEVIARLIHKNSGRSGSFVAVNCGALSESLLESELFGHMKGAFTGAVANKAGIFEAAQGGTCFLDEISNTSPALQMKLLRVLEEKELLRVGSTDPVRINARVIAAANQPLAPLVAAGRFREDLFYRLKVVIIDLPPLRERRADIPLLLEHFVTQYAQASQKEIAIHEEVYSFLSAYAWPGNVRELLHAVERAIALNSSGILTIQDFPEQCRNLPPAAPNVSLPSQAGQAPAALCTLAEKEKQYLLEVLAATGQNISQAAKILGIDRRTIYRILKRQSQA